VVQVAIHRGFSWIIVCSDVRPWELGDTGHGWPRIAARNRSDLGMTAAGEVAGKAMNAQTPSLQQRGRRAMEFFTGLDVGMDETAICVVEAKGKGVLETAGGND